MLTIIFGAGASYDSHSSKSSMEKDDPFGTERPPLAKDLFDERYGDIARKYPKAKILFGHLRNARPSIEEELERLIAKAQKNPDIFSSLLSMRYYLKDVIEFSTKRWIDSFSDTSTYITLLFILNQWQKKTRSQINLVTFNYDNLLETACRDVLGIKFANIDSYINNNTPYKIYKVHGSVDWFHRVEGTGGNISQFADQLQWTHDIVMEDEKQSIGPNAEYVPAIAIPSVTKSTFELPLPHLPYLTIDIAKSTEIITIGWRGAEKHFLELLNSGIGSVTNRRIINVGTSDSKNQQVYQNIVRKSEVQYSNIKSSNKGFTYFVHNELEQYLGL